MHNAISSNPSIPGENARCVSDPANDWTETAHRIGLHFARRGTGRAERIGRQDVPGSVWNVMLDLERRGLLSRARGGWWRITDQSVALFPLNRCARWRQAFNMLWIDLDQQRARVCWPAVAPLAGCDPRPTSWALMFTHTNTCWYPAPRPERPSRRVPEHVVRGWTTNVAEFDDPERETHAHIPSLADIMRHAPEHDRSEADPSGGWWPEIGPTDKFPAARVGYSSGPRIERSYA